MSKQSLQSILKFIESQAGCDMVITSAAQDGLKTLALMSNKDFLKGRRKDASELEFDRIKKLTDPDEKYSACEKLVGENESLIEELQEFCSEVEAYQEDIDIEFEDADDDW